MISLTIRIVEYWVWNSVKSLQTLRSMFQLFSKPIPSRELCHYCGSIGINRLAIRLSDENKVLVCGWEEWRRFYTLPHILKYEFCRRQAYEPGGFSPPPRAGRSRVFRAEAEHEFLSFVFKELQRCRYHFCLLRWSARNLNAFTDDWPTLTPLTFPISDSPALFAPFWPHVLFLPHSMNRKFIWLSI
jgi:hypothetical protein